MDSLPFKLMMLSAGLDGGWITEITENTSGYKIITYHSRGLAIDSSGNVFTSFRSADANDSNRAVGRIVKLSPTGAFSVGVTSNKVAGTSDYAAEWKNIDVDSSGNVYVVGGRQTTTGVANYLAKYNNSLTFVDDLIIRYGNKFNGLRIAGDVLYVIGDSGDVASFSTSLSRNWHKKNSAVTVGGHSDETSRFGISPINNSLYQPGYAGVTSFGTDTRCTAVDRSAGTFSNVFAMRCTSPATSLDEWINTDCDSLGHTYAAGNIGGFASVTQILTGTNNAWGWSFFTSHLPDFNGGLFIDSDNSLFVSGLDTGNRSALVKIRCSDGAILDSVWINDIMINCIKGDANNIYLQGVGVTAGSAQFEKLYIFKIPRTGALPRGSFAIGTGSITFDAFTPTIASPALGVPGVSATTTNVTTAIEAVTVPQSAYTPAVLTAKI